MSFLNQLKDATIGGSGYPRLIKDQASGFGFITLLLLIVLTISAFITTLDVNRSVAQVVDQLASGPDFAFHDGTFEFSGKMPYQLGDSSNPMIIDTTGQTSLDVLTGHASGVLLTKDKLYQVQGGTAKVTDLSSIPLNVDKQTVISLMHKIPVLVVVGYVFLFLFQLGFKALDAVVLAGIAGIYGAVTKRRVPFSLGFKVGLYAMSLPILLQWIWPGYTTQPWRGGAGVAGFLVWWGLAITYLVLGLRAYFRLDTDLPIDTFGE